MRRWQQQRRPSKTTGARNNCSKPKSTERSPGVSQAQAEIAAAQAGMAAAQADLDRTLSERNRQEALIETNSTTRQKVEQAVADEQGSRAQLVSRHARWSRPRQCYPAVNRQSKPSAAVSTF